MNILKKIIITTCLLFASQTFALHPANTKAIPLNELAEFDQYPTAVQELLKEARTLSKKNLTYLYGSADPRYKGMDCSGTINYLLKQKHIASPRQANQLYLWVQNEGTLHKVRSGFFGKDKLADLKPGDLIFWSGTYKVKRTPPITHVMLYLGKDKNGQPLMFGSSNGRPYKHKSMYGVSVFDFTYPYYDSGKLVGYGCIPGLTCQA